MNKYRTHNCSELNENDISSEVSYQAGFIVKRSWKFTIYRFEIIMELHGIRNNNRFFSILEKIKPESVLK